MTPAPLRLPDLPWFSNCAANAVSPGIRTGRRLVSQLARMARLSPLQRCRTATFFRSVGRIVPRLIALSGLPSEINPACNATTFMAKYGQALARLLAHELYHVLNQTAGHAQTGIAKAQLTAAELVAERFQFDGPAFMPQISKSPIPAP